MYIVEGGEAVLTSEVGGEDGEEDDADCKEPCQNLIHSLGHPKVKVQRPCLNLT